MVSFDVYLNSFSGSMQSAIKLFLTSNLTLYSLDLSNNLFTGYIPPEISLFTSLANLFVSFNSLQGTIPREIGLITNLQALDLSFCGISGTIPKEIFKPKYFRDLWLTGNLLTNTIPTEIVLLPILKNCDLANNFLSGTLPDFSLMSTLENLNLRSNFLSGQIANLSLSSQKLKTIILADNMLSGSFSSILGNGVFPKLVSIDVSKTMMTGVLPNFDLIAKKLEVFAAASNCLEGSIPDSICSAKLLTTLILDGMVSGANCVSYIYEDRKNNIMGFNGVTNERAVSGSIPDCIFSLAALETLHISGNGLTGSIPSSISTSIQRLSASFNRLQGSIPDGLLNLKLAELDLSHNKIAGSIRSNNWDADGFLSLKNNR
jgi:LRR receptor-like serine/threonine-protein kinase FLS2